MSATTIPTIEDELAAADAEEPMLRKPAAVDDTPAALLAECTCPEWCEHDHENE